MDLQIRGLTALVLGAGGGLGHAISLALAREGAQVALADIDEAALERTRSAVVEAGGVANAVTWDISRLPDVRARIGAISAMMGQVDILVNNTGGPPPSSVTAIPPEKWLDHFRMMVLSVVSITDAVLPGMRAQRWGRIVTSASSGIISPIPNLGLSNALRSTLVGWSKTLAREVAPDNITVNIVVPGRIATGRIRALDEAKAQREGRGIDVVREESLSAIPMGRYGEPCEYADAVAFLASERASYITGSVLRVDGGYISNV